MAWQDLVLDGYGRIMGSLETALKGMTPDDLDWQPRPDCNSMGWLAWHISRLQDSSIASLMAEEQVWTSGRWYARFGRPPDAYDIGFGHTPEQVAAFRSPSAETFLEYHRDVLALARRYISGLSSEELGRELDEPWFQPLPTVGVRLVSVMCDCLKHVGQAAYVRGLLKGKG
jgi:hypothetical protein